MMKKRHIGTVILAGGFGTRLSPLTDTKPKPLVKILDVTVLENTLEKLISQGFSDITVSTHYKAEMVENVCKKYKGVVCKRETYPLGTAGGVKNCCDGNFEAVLVVSGDAVFDFNLRDAVEYHFANNNDVTIVSCRKKDPTEYGVMLTDDDGNVVRFCEKPTWKNVKSDVVNTGIYVLSKQTVCRIPDNISCDFSKNLFPALMKEGRRISAFAADGYWCDVGSIDEYYECNRYAATGNITLYCNKGQSVSEMVNKGIHVSEGVYVSQSAVPGRNVSLSDGSVVCEGCHVSDDCDITASLVGSNTKIGKGTSLCSCIVGENVQIGDNCIIPKGCIIGDGAVTDDGTVLDEYSVIKPYEHIIKEDTLSRFVKCGFTFVDDGVAVYTADKSLDEVMCFAKAVCLAFKRENGAAVYAAIMSSEKDNLYVKAFASAMGECDAEVFDLGNGEAEMLKSAAALVRADFYVHTSLDEKRMTVTVASENADVIDGTTERKIMKIYNELRENSGENAYEIKVCNAVEVPFVQMYTMSIVRLAKKVLKHANMSDFGIYLKGPTDSAAAQAFRKIYESLGGKILAGVDEKARTVYIDSMNKVVLKCGDVSIDKDHMCAAVVKRHDELFTGSIVFGNNVPSVIREMISKQTQPHDEICLQDNIYNDGVMALVMFLVLIKISGEDERALMNSVPPFEIYKDEYIADVNRGATMERLSRFYNDSDSNITDGIRITLADGNVTVIPNRVRGFKIISEAANMEAAKELAVRIGKTIKNEE